MAVDSSTSILNSLLEKLRLDDPWLPPRSWDSHSSQGGASSSHPPPHSSTALYATSTVSEPSLVRLAMNALQGVESALISIEKLSALLFCSSADRTSHRNPSLWNRSSSTVAIGNLLTSIGQFGCMIFLLRGFVDYFTSPNYDGVRELEENSNSFTLVNQAFAISVGKVLNGYISALNTLSASVSLRRSLKTKDGGCLTNIGHSEMTLLEVYLHTEGLRIQMQALGNLCNVNHLTTNFPVSSLEDLRAKSNSEFSFFPRSGALLSFLYTQLKVADPGHCALLKFLFLQSYKPYCDFIRSWIYDGSISDPYNEFVVECISDASVGTGISSNVPLPTIRVRDEVDVPCFLQGCLIPLCRTGQQLQVIMKLLDQSNDVGTCFCHEKILPRLVGLASEYPGSFPLIFDKEAIEAMVNVRATYHQQLLEKVDSVLDKLDFSSRQAAHQSVSLSLANKLKNHNHLADSATDESSTLFGNDKKSQNMRDVTVDTEVPSIIHDDSYAEDLLESSECSSAYESSEEKDEAEKLISSSYIPDTSYLSALDISMSLSTNNRIQTLETLGSSGEYHICQFDSHCEDRVEHDQLHSPDCGLEQSVEDYGWLNTNFDFSGIALTNIASNKDQHPLVTHASSQTSSLQLSKLKYDSSFFSMNPILKKCSFFSPRSMLGERGLVSHNNADFDFSSVKVPLDTYAGTLASVSKIGNEVRVVTETPAVTIDTRNHLDLAYHSDNIIDNNAKLSSVSSPPQNSGDEENLLPSNISGGSAWQSLLGRCRNKVDRSINDQKMKLVTGADMPLDFVITKCVLEEIALHPLREAADLGVNMRSLNSEFRSACLLFLEHIFWKVNTIYTYISKLTIKMLIEGFKLQEHLQSLRCYHFMELADWADLFIMSLRNCKWDVDGVDKRIPEIQGILEQAVRRSSCEKDPNKNRLYVYLKGDGIRYLSPSAIGIHSFDYLGLGYQIGWPVSIILTPAALKLYSNIFNFLIQIKLAVFALSDVWCSLKGYHFKQQKAKAQQFSLLTETRHKINHFVSTLQQYVLSHLSQVSWYRFIHSLKHKVKDMLDLESVHMGYLTESLHICFLSNETQSIAGIIRNILQCAMDFRSCFAGSIMEAAAHDGNFSHINISQVQVIRRAFIKNLEELYLIYLQSPKHGEFGLSRFWEFLNYNEYYAGVMNKRMGHCIFYS